MIRPTRKIKDELEDDGGAPLRISGLGGGVRTDRAERGQDQARAREKAAHSSPRANPKASVRANPADQRAERPRPKEKPVPQNDSSQGGRVRSGQSRAGKPLTEARIRNISEHYVSQRECSQAMLRETLERRLYRRCMQLSGEEAKAERDAATPLFEAEIARLVGLGLIDDQRFAEMKVRIWLGQGRGARRIMMDLAQKGIDQDTAQDALAAASRETTGLHDEDMEIDDVVESAEWEAADALARKKRIGKYRNHPMPEAYQERAKIWRREASMMARAGFGIDMIKQIIDQEPEADDGF